MLKVKEFNTIFNPLEIYNLFKDDINSIFLDSSKEDENLSKFSFIGINPFLVFESIENKAFINKEKVEGDPFKVLEDLILKYSFKEENFKEIPLLGGAIGYISYDTSRIIEKIPNTSKEDFSLNDMRFVFYRNIIIFDLINKKQYITSLDGNDREIEDILNTINKAKSLKEEKFEELNNEFISNFKKEEYIAAIKKLKDYIESGDVYIANLT